MDSVDELQRLTTSLGKKHCEITTDSDLEYLRAIKKILAEEYYEPSLELTRFFASHIQPGEQTQQVLEQFRPIVREALRQFGNDLVANRLQSRRDVFKHKVVGEINTANTDATVIADEDFERFFVVNIA